MNSRAAVEETAEDRALNSIGLEEEIIELQDLRMSPIPSLRNRHKAKYYKEPGGRLHGMCPKIKSLAFLKSDITCWMATNEQSTLALIRFWFGVKGVFRQRCKISFSRFWGDNLYVVKK